MLKNLKLGTKMIGGFVLVAAIVAVVGFFGWNGARQLQEHIHDLGEVHLIGTENLGEIKAEANAASVAINTILNPRLSAQQRTNQYDALADIRERYQVAWDEYEALPRTPEAQRLWGEFEQAWEGWRTANNEVLTMSREIDATGILNPDAFESQLVGFIRDHHVVMERVLLLLATGEEFEGGDDPTACALGRWLATYETDNPSVARLLEDIHVHHDPFHASVGEVKQLAGDGQSTAALATFESLTRPSAEGVFDVLDDLESEAEQVVARYNEMNQTAFGEVATRQATAVTLLDEIIGLNDQEAEHAVAEADAAGAGVQLIALVGIIAGVVLALVLGVILTRAITKPIEKGVRFAQQIARGKLEIELDINQRDEVGVLADALRGMLESLQYKAGLLAKIAQGDLTVDVQLASEDDGLGESMTTMVESLNDILGQVQVAVDQVAAGASQVSSASQDLSQGATESASSLEEISSSVNEINGQSHQNTESAAEASTLSRQAATDAETGQTQMKELQEAMLSISSASDEITKVVKVIDDIAFQINLLALNANVEAARAGKYGKGFAVVAEEVRNLATRSADAVKETTAMVEQSVTSIGTGNELTSRTAEQLTSIVSGAARVAEFLEEIAAASREQSLAIYQITEGLGQVDQVTQSNTASAEESASASEELSSQAEQLRSAIAVFRLKRQAAAAIAAPARAHRAEAHPASAGGANGRRNGKDGRTGDHAATRQSEAGEPREHVAVLDDDEFDRF